MKKQKSGSSKWSSIANVREPNSKAAEQAATSVAPKVMKIWPGGVSKSIGYHVHAVHHSERCKRVAPAVVKRAEQGLGWVAQL